jgi:Uma2 family endonuclease
MDREKKKRHLIQESPMTYEDYAALPDEEGVRYELDDGFLYLMTPSPTPVHQAISYQLQYLLNTSCRADYMIFSSPIDVILSRKEVKQPDIVMIQRSRLHLVTKRGIEGPPDLVVEIMSEYSRKRDKVYKRKVYARYHIPEYWTIDLTNYTLEQYVLNKEDFELIEIYAEDEEVRSERLPCVSLTVNQLLVDLPELADD